jgi:RsiW-degrading membrane proteinase PrsW (M82 family)
MKQWYSSKSWLLLVWTLIFSDAMLWKYIYYVFSSESQPWMVLVTTKLPTTSLLLLIAVYSYPRDMQGLDRALWLGSRVLAAHYTLEMVPGIPFGR